MPVQKVSLTCVPTAFPIIVLRHRFRVARISVNMIVVIPARFASSRLPGKPLLRETGQFLIEHVYERAMQVKSATAVVVATDDLRIYAAVTQFGGRAMMTRDDHSSGTDRVAEVAMQFPNADVILNLQGDEPLFDPEAIDALAAMMRETRTDVGTLATPIRNHADYNSRNCVKVVCDDTGRAMYFSRSPIPCVRDGEPDFHAEPPLFLQHVGIYAYRRETLLRLAQTPPHPIETAEKLEQLRLLATGGVIRVGIIAQAHRGVDTPEDYAAFIEFTRATARRRAA